MSEPDITETLISLFSERSKTQESISPLMIGKDVFDEKHKIYQEVVFKLGAFIPTILPRVEDFVAESERFECPDLNKLDSKKKNEAAIKAIPELERLMDQSSPTINYSDQFIVRAWTLFLVLESFYSIVHKLDSISLRDLLRMDTIGLTLVDKIGPSFSNIDKHCSEFVRTSRSSKAVKTKKGRSWQNIIDEFYKMDRDERTEMKPHTLARAIKKRLSHKMENPPHETTIKRCLTAEGVIQT